MPAVEVKNLGKKFRLRHLKGQTLKATVIERILSREARRDFWALQDISFSVAPGEVLGIIGSNGSGKTTLLSLLARTMVPTVGSLQVNGRVSSLLELGAGFHPDLTGRENIYLNASIMGIPRATVNKKFQQIVDFSGLGNFIETPIKFYSSGMIVRLGFSVAVEVEPDILLVDEVLAVGDEVFQEKSCRRIMQFKESNKTIIVVSHDMHMIESFCGRAIQLSQGRIVKEGAVDKVVSQYIQGAKNQPGAGAEVAGIRHEWGNREARILGARVYNREGKETRIFRSGEEASIKLRFSARKKIEKPVFGFAIHDSEYTLCFGSSTQLDNYFIPAISGEGEITLRLGRLPFLTGRYFLSFSIHSQDHLTNYHRQEFYYSFEVTAPRPGLGIVSLPVRWELS
jgi:ABC-type polysaccharide/polyol phosphate transport system ATPase subunit